MITALSNQNELKQLWQEICVPVIGRDERLQLTKYSMVAEETVSFEAYE
jgi:hypothetical protein